MPSYELEFWERIENPGKKAAENDYIPIQILTMRKYIPQPLPQKEIISYEIITRDTYQGAR